MSNEKYQLGDVLVKSLTITRQAGGEPRDIIPQVIQLNLYEDIEMPYLSLDLYIVDAIGLLKTFPVIGEEFVDLEFETPGRQSYKTRLTPYEVVLGQGSDNQTTQSYCIKCISEEVFNHSIATLEKGYKDTIDHIIQDIVKEKLKSKKKIFIEQTKGIQEIAFTRKTPFEGIDMLRKRAISQKNLSSTFHFFENKYGYNFQTLEGLMDEGKKNIKDKIFTRYQVLNQENQNPAGYRQILAYNIGRQFNTISSLSLGALMSYHETFDIVKKEFKKKKYTISEFPQFKSSDDNPVTPFGPLTIQQHGKDSAVRYFNISNSAMPDTYLNDTLAKKIAFLSIQFNGSVELYCYGDSSITIGDVIKIDLPKTDASTKVTPGKEPLQNGNYVVTRVNHSIQFSAGRPKHTTSMTCIRGTYSQG